MCLICIEFDKRRMNIGEARRALGEMRRGLDPAHVEEVEAKLAEAESADPGGAAPATPTP
ncbi:MAG TPA: hypothetical protein VFS43_36645 [Polyangiaceae bacterium]|nr:hypothetical protein [Polyangiaceae bacterium]